MRLGGPQGRPTSFSLEGYKQAIREQSRMFSQYGIHIRAAEEGRGWTEQGSEGNERSSDRNPIYVEITDLAVPGSPNGIGGLMKG